MKTYFKKGRFALYKGDCVKILPELNVRPKMIFADPPYFLSGGGTTCKSGKRKSVNKGKWDTEKDIDFIHSFNIQWLKECKNILDGTIWVCGTYHNIYSVGMALQQLDYKILNNVVWEKTNPPPNLGCRSFTHSNETIIWATKSDKRHTFNYGDMKINNGGKQMKDVWKMGTPKKVEKSVGKHPTQKPEALLERIILSSTEPGDLVLDPFNGSGTAGIVATRLGREYIGIEKYKKYCDLSIERYCNG